MNRTIKFRVWDIEKKSFILNDETHTISFDIWDWTSKMSDCLIYPSETYVFQQFTGLQDKNKVEIYEGDIIKGSWLPLDLVAEIYYHNEGAGFRFSGIQDRRFDGYLSQHTINNFDPIRVIGNIFENPELLK